MSEYVSLHISEYARLQSDSEFLSALRSAGVDNWDGYSHACEITNASVEDED